MIRQVRDTTMERRPHDSLSPCRRRHWAPHRLTLVLLLMTLAAGNLPSADGPATDPETPPTPPAAAVEQPGLEVYDFTSDWDQGAMGKQAGRVLRGKARRLKLFAMLVDLDREAVIEEAPAPAGYADDPAAWVAHARSHFDTRWIAGGKLSQYDAKTKSFVMDLTVIDIGVKNADGGWPEAKTVCAKRFAVEADIFLPPLMDQVLTAISGPHLARGTIVYPKIAARGDNLLANGGFEQVDDQGFALHWADSSAKKSMIRTVPKPADLKPTATAPDAPAAPAANTCMQLAPDRDMATTYGLICYSDPIPVQPDTAYQLSMNIRAQDISVIVWVKGYSMVNGRLRNTYKHQKRFYPDKPGRWNAWSTEAFLPKHPQTPITQMRVMLYTYGGDAGTAWFDDVDLRAVTVEGELPKADFEIPDRATEGWRQADAGEEKSE